MTLRLFQTGLMPIGHFDFIDSQIPFIRGGELAVFDHADPTLFDVFTPDVYGDPSRTLLRLARDTDTGPFFLIDGDRNSGALAEVSTETTTLFSSASPQIRGVNTSGKFAVFASDGFYSVTSDVIDTDTIDQDTLPNTRLYVNQDGLLTAIPSASTVIAGYFVEYRLKSVENARLFNFAGADRNLDTLIFYKSSADGYNTAESIAAVVSQHGYLGTPTDGTYNDGYFTTFEATTRIADAIDAINELLDVFSATGNDGYGLLELAGTVALRPIREKYLQPSFQILDFNALDATFELGQWVSSPEFAADYSFLPESAVLSDSDGYSVDDVSATPTEFSSSHTYSKNTNAASVIFTLASVNADEADSDIVTLIWQPRVFYGAGAGGGSTEDFLEALAESKLAPSRKITFNTTAGASQFIYYAYPTAYGAATLAIGNSLGGFSLVSDTISVTNSFGETQDYSLYQSISSGLGNVTIVVT